MRLDSQSDAGDLESKFEGVSPWIKAIGKTFFEENALKIWSEAAIH